MDTAHLRTHPACVDSSCQQLASHLGCFAVVTAAAQCQYVALPSRYQNAVQMVQGGQRTSSVDETPYAVMPAAAPLPTRCAAQQLLPSWHALRDAMAATGCPKLVTEGGVESRRHSITNNSLALRTTGQTVCPHADDGQSICRSPTTPLTAQTRVLSPKHGPLGKPKRNIWACT